MRAAASQDEQLAELKAEIMDSAEDGLLYEASGEEWRLDPEGSWQISKMITRLDATSLPVTTSMLQQSMSDAMDRIAGHLSYDVPHAIHLLPEALQTHADRLCVTRQVAKIMERDLGYVCEALDEIAATLYDSMRKRPHSLAIGAKRA